MDDDQSKSISGRITTLKKNPLSVSSVTPPDKIPVRQTKIENNWFKNTAKQAFTKGVFSGFSSGFSMKNIAKEQERQGEQSFVAARNYAKTYNNFNKLLGQRINILSAPNGDINMNY